MITKNSDGRLVIDDNRLTLEQKERYQTVKWLINDNPRGMGRSHLMALAFVQKALDCPNTRVYFFDHDYSQNPMTMRHMRNLIHSLIFMIDEELKKNNIRIGIGENHIRAEWVGDYRNNQYSKKLKFQE